MIHLPADHVRFTITRDVPWAALRGAEMPLYRLCHMHLQQCGRDFEAKTDRSAVFVIFAPLGRRSDDKNSAGRQALDTGQHPVSCDWSEEGDKESYIIYT